MKTLSSAKKIPSAIRACQTVRKSFGYWSLALCMGALSACGGGGGGGGGSSINNLVTSGGTTNSWKSGVFKDSDEFKNLCLKPRVGQSPVTSIPYPDRKGTWLDEKNWLRSWSNETYLWYKEIKDTNPNNALSPQDYFENLVTFDLTSNGQRKDKYHYTRPTAEVEAEYIGGSVFGYGLGLRFVKNTPPRELRLGYVEPNSPAENAGLTRGIKIVSVDGVDLVNDNTSNGIDTLNSGLFPSDIGEVHTFGIESLTGIRTTVTLQSADVTTSPVHMSRLITVGASDVGYVVFNSHIQLAETQLYNAVDYFAAVGVSDLVLDMRYNGGGLLQIAAELGYMIAGSKSKGKVFEQLVFNDKFSPDDPFNFQSAGVYGSTRLLNLPTLNLSRVFVLTTSSTCSASESTINGLRGIGVEVILIGGQTCGKPYGFYSTDNCGTTYSTIQFSGINAKGFGDYSDGFIPGASDNGKDKVKGCLLEDDLNHDLGDTQERLLKAALAYRTSGSCGVTASAQKTVQPAAELENGEPGLALDIGWTQSKIIQH